MRERRARPAVRRARAPADAALPASCSLRERAARAVRHRRGALRVPVGPRLPPGYLQLAVLHERFPGVPRIALTATADDADARRHRRAPAARATRASSFAASTGPNIRYAIVEKDDARAQLLRFIRDEHAGEAGIVYCLSRKKVEETAACARRARASTRCRTTPGWTPTRAGATRTASCARTAS